MAETGLTQTEYLILATLAAGLDGPWYLQRDVDDRGSVSAGIVSDDGCHDDDTQVFLIARADGGLHLGYGQGNFHAELGIFHDIDSVAAAIRNTLAASAVIERFIRSL